MRKMPLRRLVIGAAVLAALALPGLARAHGGVAGARNTSEGADVWLVLPVS